MQVFASRKRNMETYRSGHNEHDWKSCCRDERHVGSNPTVSAKGSEWILAPFRFFFAKKHARLSACFSAAGPRGIYTLHFVKRSFSKGLTVFRIKPRFGQAEKNRFLCFWKRFFVLCFRAGYACIRRRYPALYYNCIF